MAGGFNRPMSGGSGTRGNPWDAITDLQKRLTALERAAYQRGGDVEIANMPDAQRRVRLILYAPNGGRWNIFVSNAGVVTTASLPQVHG
jgi:hypothetical protein